MLSFMKTLQIRIPSELKLELKVYAARNKLYLTDILRSLIANQIGRPDLAPVKGRLPNPEGERKEMPE